MSIIADAINFSLRWRSKHAEHIDNYVLNNVDPESDHLPPGLLQGIEQVTKDEHFIKEYAAGELVPPYSENNITEFDKTRFDASFTGMDITPRVGRFYPQAFARQAFNCSRRNYTPMRIIEDNDTRLTVDSNHPLAAYPITVSAAKIETGPYKTRHNEPRNVVSLLTENGPGMQARYQGRATDFFADYPFARKNDADDSAFYESARMVNHLDRTAIGEISALYGRLLTPDMEILDLMSSWVSHLPAGLEDCETIGLGMNAEELGANPQLDGFVIHDLNNNPIMPFQDGEFDAVICTASVEYLVQPIEVIADIARVLRPGGVLVMTFSDRWFPGKEILPWSEMHPFERLGMVTDFVINTDAFEQLHTETVRGLPRPFNDKYIRERKLSDPLFAVWGQVTT